MASGVAIDDSVKEAYTAMKKDKVSTYLILKIEDSKKIVVDFNRKSDGTVSADAIYDEFLAELEEAKKAKQCRYAIYDFEYMKHNTAKWKLMFWLWNPDEASVKQKMLYASSKGALGQALEPGKKFEQANEACDLHRETWCKELEKLDRA